MILKRICLLSAVTWTIAIMVVCWVPINIVIPIQKSGGWLFELPDLDKIIHFSIFAIFAGLWYFGLGRPAQWWKILVGGIVLAALTEIVQAAPMIGRQSDFDDACYDVAGVLIGLLLMSAVTGYLFKKSNRSSAETVT